MKQKQLVAPLVAILGLFVWITDAAIDSLFFYEETFLESLLYDVPAHEVYIRLLSLVCFCVFGIVVERILAKREQTEEALRLSEQRLSTHLQDTPIGALSWDLNFKAIEWNPAAEAIFGYTKEEASGKHAGELILPEDVKELGDDIFQDLLAEEGGTRSINENITKDGRRIVCDWYNTTIKDADGTVIGVASLVNDITERKLTEEGLRASEERLRSLLQDIQAAVVVHGPDTEILTCNKTSQELLGLTEDQMLGKQANDPYWKFFNEDGSDMPLEHYPVNRVITTKNVLKDLIMGIYRPITNDVVSVLVNAIPETDDDGNIFRVIVTFMDITERKRVEENLLASEEKFRRIFENSPYGITLATPEGRLLDASPAFIHMLGYESREELIAFSSESGLSKLYVSPPKRTEVISKALVSGGWQQSEVQFHRKDRTVMDARLTYQIDPISGNINGFVEDITDQRKAESDLWASETRYQDLYANAPDMFASVDAKTARVIECNQTMSDALGYEKEEIIGRPVFDFYAPESSEHARSTVFPLFLKQGRIDGEEMQLQKKDGSIIDTSLKATAIRDEDGNILYSQSIWRDITQQKTLEDQLRQALKMESIGTLAGGIAHDFNNILGIILGNTEMAMIDVPDWNPARTNLSEIKDASLRARDITKQILAFSRKAEHELKPIQIGSVVSDSLKLIRSTIPTTIEVHQDIPEEIGVIMGDSTQINQVLLNLCTNARHSMREEEGTLNVTLERIYLDDDGVAALPDLTVGDYVRLSIGDTGQGIAPDQIHRIFDPYFTTKKVGEGSGMGLAMVHGIVKQHNGAITVASEVGKGTTFNVFFPIAGTEPKLEPDRDEVIPRGNENILFVDDEPAMTHIYRSMLGRLGYSVSIRTSSIEALEAFKAQPDKYDLVITDQTMPHMTGKVLATEIMAIRPDIPVILCTGHSDQINRGTAERMGIKAFIMKPIVMGEIASTIRKVLGE